MKRAKEKQKEQLKELKESARILDQELEEDNYYAPQEEDEGLITKKAKSKESAKDASNSSSVPGRKSYSGNNNVPLAPTGHGVELLANSIQTKEAGILFRS